MIAGVEERVSSDTFVDAVAEGLKLHAAELGENYRFGYVGKSALHLRRGIAGGYLGHLLHVTVNVQDLGFGTGNDFGELSVVAFPPSDGTGRKLPAFSYTNTDQFPDGSIPAARDWNGGSVVAEAVLSLFALDLGANDSEPVMHALHLGKTTSEGDRIIRAGTVGQSREFFEATMAGSMVAEPTATLTVLDRPNASRVLIDAYPAADEPALSKTEALYNGEQDILQVAAILAVRIGTGFAQQGMIPQIGTKMPLAFG